MIKKISAFALAFFATLALAQSTGINGGGPNGGGGGGVSNLTAGTGITLTPNPIVGAGTIALTTPVASVSGGTGVSSPTGHSVTISEGSAPFNTVTLSADQVLRGLSGADPSGATLPDCNGSGNALNYTQSTHLFSCLGTVGTVTSVGLTTPSWLTVSGTPVTTAGTLAVTASTGQTANNFLATPNGSTGAVGLRTIVAADLPGTITSNTSGNAGTATALAATPTQCSANQFATGIAASGNANCASITSAGALVGTSGTFTATFASGCTTTPTATFNYTTDGLTATLSLTGSNFTCTSNSGQISITGTPAAAIPAHQHEVACYDVEDNGNPNLMAACRMTSGGTLSVGMCTTGSPGAPYVNCSPAGGNFTSSGTKGVTLGWTITYSLQ